MQIAQRIGCREDRPKFSRFDIAEEVGENTWILPRAAHKRQVFKIERAQVELNNWSSDGTRSHVAATDRRRVEQRAPPTRSSTTSKVSRGKASSRPSVTSAPNPSSALTFDRLVNAVTWAPRRLASCTAAEPTPPDAR